MIEFQRHGVAYNLKSVIKTAIMLAVDEFFMLVGDINYLLSVIAVLAGLIDFKLHPHK